MDGAERQTVGPAARKGAGMRAAPMMTSPKASRRPRAACVSALTGCILPGGPAYGWTEAAGSQVNGDAGNPATGLGPAGYLSPVHLCVRRRALLAAMHLSVREHGSETPAGDAQYVCVAVVAVAEERTQDRDP